MRAYTINETGTEITTNFLSGQRVVFEAASFLLNYPSIENIILLQ